MNVRPHHVLVLLCVFGVLFLHKEKGALKYRSKCPGHSFRRRLGRSSSVTRPGLVVSTHCSSRRRCRRYDMQSKKRRSTKTLLPYALIDFAVESRPSLSTTSVQTRHQHRSRDGKCPRRLNSAKNRTIRRHGCGNMRQKQDGGATDMRVHHNLLYAHEKTAKEMESVALLSQMIFIFAERERVNGDLLVLDR